MVLIHNLPSFVDYLLNFKKSQKVCKANKGQIVKETQLLLVFKQIVMHEFINKISQLSIYYSK